MERARAVEVLITGRRLTLMGTIFSIPVVVGAVILYPLARGIRQASFVFGLDSMVGILVFLLVYLALIALHELLHGLGYRWLGKAETKYSVDWRHMLALAAAQSPMPIAAYRWSVLLPTLALALPMFLIGLAAGCYPVYFMGVLHVVSGVGDFWILWALRRFSADAVVMDHPDKPGCLVYPGEK